MAGYKCLLFQGHLRKTKTTTSFHVLMQNCRVSERSSGHISLNPVVCPRIGVVIRSTVTSGKIILPGFWKSRHKSPHNHYLLPFSYSPLSLLLFISSLFFFLFPLPPLSPAPSSLHHMLDIHLFYHFIQTSKKRDKRLI